MRLCVWATHYVEVSSGQKPSPQAGAAGVFLDSMYLVGVTGRGSRKKRSRAKAGKCT